MPEVHNVDEIIAVEGPLQRRPERVRRAHRLRTALLSVGALGAIAIGGVPSAAFAVPPNPNTLQAFSTDQSAGTGVAKVTWYAADRFKVDWENTDNSSDGRGPILFVNEVRKDSPDYVGKNIVYNHNFSGTPFSTSGSRTVDENATSIYQNVIEVRLRECNGGSQSAPTNCSSWKVAFNPYYYYP